MKNRPIKLYTAPVEELYIYYGCSDGCIYVVFTEPYLTFEGKKKEYIISRHLNYKFDYDTGTVFKRGKVVSPEILDKPPIHLQDIAKSQDVPDDLEGWLNSEIAKIKS